MSILIRGMDLPENCMDCPVDFPTCDLWTHSAFEGIKGNPYYIRHPNCPLIEVPAPHGRLIDADALKAEFPEPDDWTDSRNTLVHKTGIYACIDLAPTIIEAEEGE